MLGTAPLVATATPLVRGSAVTINTNWFGCAPGWRQPTTTRGLRSSSRAAGDCPAWPYTVVESDKTRAANAVLCVMCPPSRGSTPYVRANSVPLSSDGGGGPDVVRSVCLHKDRAVLHR